MTIRRETEPGLINKIANHPSVWPHIARHGEPIDFSSAFPSTRSGVVVLTNGEDAAMVFEQTAHRFWQVCTMFEDTCRGERALETGKEMRDYMRPYADVVHGVVPDTLPHAKRFYEKLGGVRIPDIEVGGEKVQAINVNGEWLVAQPGEEMYAMRLN
ncbi:hypothetical protein FPZ24_08140 [Sphingomonas panacisoli]|uniref:Uncharacterized protein n=1 Tax=Sphingomonas panacisoli TaxID=1813879 RepID=A0A5B8LH87_9SPHN|nr:hypothetical protein [Sphingomonas panacisoli]QDZ07453.1 hypothetical protein FPZ24_08140 [Sphingomonas panacisoli]